MIYAVQGKITEKGSCFIVIKSGSFFYQVFITNLCLKKIKIEQTIKLYTHLEIKENALELYGFKNKQELQYFKYLRSISGVGPKSAMNILSLIKTESITEAILNEKVNILTQVPGIGKKIAQRIILELKEKIIKGGVKTKEQNNDENLVVTALINMGYSSLRARQAVEKIPSDIKEIKEKIKLALKYLSQK